MHVRRPGQGVVQNKGITKVGFCSELKKTKEGAFDARRLAHSKDSKEIA